MILLHSYLGSHGINSHITADLAHRLVRLLAAVCVVGLLGGLAVGVWFLGESLHLRKNQ